MAIETLPAQSPAAPAAAVPAGGSLPPDTELKRVFRSSTFRLALSYAALFGLSVLLLLSFIYWSTAGALTRQMDATIAADITGLAERYRLTNLRGLVQLIDERISRKPDAETFYLLVDASNRRIVGNLDRWPTGEVTEDGWLTTELVRVDEQGQPERHSARARANVLPGGFQLLVGRDNSALEGTRELILRTLGWGLGLTLLLAVGGGVLMARNTTRRLESINQISREIMRGDLSRRIPERGSDDEFDQLADNLNIMLDRIEVLMEDVRRVSDNIAHDLRTPLTRLRHRLEGLRGAANVGGDIDETIAEADGLLSTFAALLRIARIESGNTRGDFQPCSVNDVLNDVLELYEPLAEEQRIDLQVNLQDSPSIQGDRDLLFQAFANLLDNALKFSSPAQSINITLTADETQLRVCIADQGPGIPEQDHGDVFKRFYRLEASRNTPGNGLGLSLVAAVVELHGAHIELGDARPGLSVNIGFPLEGSVFHTHVARLRR